jgi:hypothetical protein
MDADQDTAATKRPKATPMRLSKTSPLLLAIAIGLTGCARHYVMKLTNGAQITTAGKPKLKDGIYYFKDAKGEEHAVGEARVYEVAPAGMIEKANKQKPMITDPQKKRKWYYLWLA